MIRKTVSALILVPLAILIVAFSVANRQAVVVSLDPFDQEHPAHAITLPLFALSLAFVVAGVIVGGVAAWLRQGRWRWRARRFETEARALRRELEQLKRRRETVEPAIRSLPVVDAPRLTIPPRP